MPKAKKKPEIGIPEINIGLVGHVDHGKTTLTAALSGKWTDVHSEELKRGITIKLGYADAKLGERTVSFVDAPGHETLMAIMISGASIMDAAILLIAANESVPQPQTQEHITALKILGIKDIIVVQNKIDLVTKAQAKENYKQIKNFLKDQLGFEVPVIPVSAQKKVNIDLLIEAINTLFPTPKRNKKEDSEMLIVRSFDVNKPGTSIPELKGGVLGGAITHGTFKVGDKIEIRPGLKIESKGSTTWKPIQTEIVEIMSGHQKMNEKGQGGLAAVSTLLDPNLTKSDGLVGNLAGHLGELPPVLNNLEVQVTLFEKVVGVKEDIPITELKMQEPLMISAGTATTLGIVTQVGKKAKMNLKRPVAVRKGTKVALSRRIGNRFHLIGFGEVL